MTKIKIFRVVFSLLFFISLGIYFLGFVFFPIDLGNALASAQLIPSISKAISVALVPFLLIAGGLIALTLVFGRVYCSFLCPLGTAQDALYHISRKRKKYRHFGYLKPFAWPGYLLLAVTAAGFIFGVSAMTGLFDPFSITGRIAGDLIRPALIFVWNLIADGFTSLGVYTFEHQGMPVIPLGAALVSGAFLIGTGFMSYARGRLYCNTVCPVGGLLGLISRVSIFKLRLDRETCVSCGNCSDVCKSGCIDPKNRTLDFSRCVMCMNCLDTCAKGSIKYTLSAKPAQKNKPPLAAPLMERRAMLKELIGYGAAAAVSLVLPPKVFGETLHMSDKPVVPPGAGSVERYLSHCTSCHLCVTHCPTNVLTPSFLQFGIAGMLVPRMDYPHQFCEYNCKRCSEVCPTGAIKPITIEEKQTIQIGTVALEKTRCVVYAKGWACGACAEICPTHAAYLVEVKDGLFGPETDNTICVGCGACEFACPVKPEKAIFVQPLDVHKTAKKPKVEDAAKPADTEEFPF